MPTSDVRDAIVEMGTTIVRALDRLAAARDGRSGARRFLKELGHDLRHTIATALNKAAELRKDEPGRDLDSIETPLDAGPT